MQTQARELSPSFEGFPPQGLQAWRADFRDMSLEQVLKEADVDREYYPYGYSKAIFDRRTSTLHLYRSLDEMMTIWNNYTITKTQTMNANSTQPPNKDKAIEIAKALVCDGSNAEYSRGVAEIISDLYSFGGYCHVENSVRALHAMGVSETHAKLIYGSDGSLYYPESNS